MGVVHAILSHRQLGHKQRTENENFCLLSCSLLFTATLSVPLSRVGDPSGKQNKIQMEDIETGNEADGNIAEEMVELSNQGYFSPGCKMLRSQWFWRHKLFKKFMLICTKCYTMILFIYLYLSYLFVTDIIDAIIDKS